MRMSNAKISLTAGERVEQKSGFTQGYFQEIHLDYLLETFAAVMVYHQVHPGGCRMIFFYLRSSMGNRGTKTFLLPPDFEWVFDDLDFRAVFFILNFKVAFDCLNFRGVFLFRNFRAVFDDLNIRAGFDKTNLT